MLEIDVQSLQNLNWSEKLSYLEGGGSVTSYTLSCCNIIYTFVSTDTKYNIVVKTITTIGTIEKSLKLRCIKSTRHFN